MVHPSHPSRLSDPLLRPRYPLPPVSLFPQPNPSPGGWDGPSVQLADLKEGTNLIHPDLSSEIDHAFANCDLNLKHAGGKGFSQVYKIVTYSTDIKSQQEHISRNLRKWMPDHRATVTEIGVRELGLEGMHFEIEVEAYDPEGAAEAEK